MAQYKSYTHVLRIDKDEVQGILCGDVIVMPKLDGTNACLFMKDGTVHAGSRTREININKDNANFCKTLTLNGDKEFPQIIQYLESHPDHIVYGEWLGAEKPILAGQNEENFVDKFCTDSFMSKCQAKIMNTLDMDEWVNDKKSIGMFLNLCLNDLMEEEFWGHFKKKKGTVDLNRIQQLVFTNCRKYLNIQVYALYDFFNAAGKFIVNTYNEYAIFTLHVAIIAIYGKYLFNKNTKIKYQEASLSHMVRAMKPKQTDFQHIKRNSHTSKTFCVKPLKSLALTKIARALPRCL